MAVLPIGIGSAVAGGYQIERSLRFNSADSAYLNRTPASAGNRKTWTWSGWVKRSSFTSQGLFTAGTSPYDEFRLDGNIIRFFINGATTADLQTTSVYRDPSAWYHIILSVDTTQATASNRVKIYVNGTQATAFSTANYPAQNTDCTINNNVAHGIGYSVSNASLYLNGYLTEINFIDGQALTPSDFGETDSATGVWKPKAYSGTYGTNGFYLKFADNSGTTSTTLGKDSSGNGNNWTPNNFSVTAGAGNDSLVDSPTSYGTDTGVGGEVRGNYATLNPVDVTGSTLTNGNLDASIPFATNSICKGTLGLSSGKWYWEVTPTGGGVGGSGILVQGQAESYYPGYSSANGISYLFGGQVYRTGSAIQTYSSFTSNDVIGIALDLDNGKVFFAKNGTWQGSSDPSAGTNPAASTGISGNTWVPAGGNNSATAATQVYNFGQRPFSYTAPSGFKALCTQNLPTPTIGATSTTQANDYFNVVTFNGNGGSNAITGVGFQPDFVWVKSRSNAYSHNLHDVLRGPSSYLVSNSTVAENTSYTNICQFTSDGFTLSADNSANVAGTTNVGWAWDAGGTGVTNTAGSITSTVSANTTSGFSIVTYTGTGANATVGHGLGVAPSMIIAKLRSSTSNWPVYHRSLDAGKVVWLDLTDGQTTSVSYNGAPTSSIINLGTAGGTNTSSGTHVIYAFAPVAGYSAFGSYTGNGSTDGPFIYTGFRPRYVMVKRTDTTGWWYPFDTSRNSYNVANSIIELNGALAETTGSNYAIDINSNGFKLRSTHIDVNTSAGTYIYAAFAESPFKYSLAR